MARSRKVENEPQEVFPIDAPPGRAARKWLVQFLLPLLLGAGLLGGLLLAGHLARERLRQRGEGALAFTDVECDPPPGLSRREFLEEAQYLARLPERERRIILLRYVEELTQDEIAARMQISQMHVSRLLRRAIERMRGQLVDL